MKKIMTIFLVLPFTFSLQADEEPVGLPDELRVGDVWKIPFEYPAPCDRWEVIEAYEDEENQIIMRCQDYLLYIKNDFTNWAKFTMIDGTVLAEFEPNIPYVKFPLKVGKTWTANYTGYTADNGNRWTSYVRAEVADYEELSLGNKSFMCFRIEIDDHWQTGAFSGTNKITMWFSTEVKHVIKNVNRDYPEWSYELTNFQHQ